MASELKPCPFCSKTMMLRSALWPSEGDADAIIHADHTDCPMLGFSDGSADGSIIEKWNYSLSNEDDFPSDGSCVRCGSVPRNANGLCNTCLDEDAEHLENTRPSPVAPVTSEPWGYGWYEQGGKKMASGYLPTINYPRSEDVTEGPSPLYTAPQQPAVSPDATGKCGELETVAQAHFDEFGEFDDIAWIKGFHPHPECIQLVTRSQAEELLAAERAEKEKLEAAWLEAEGIISDLKADNERLRLNADTHQRQFSAANVRAKNMTQKCLGLEAKLAAEIRRERDLAEKQLSEVVDRMSDDYLALKAELDQAVGVIEDRSSEYEALEAKLTAAEKALKTARPYVEDYDTRRHNTGVDETLTQIDAALGGKPS